MQRQREKRRSEQKKKYISCQYFVHVYALRVTVVRYSDSIILYNVYSDKKGGQSHHPARVDYYNFRRELN
jgi:hypothetical protein